MTLTETAEKYAVGKSYEVPCVKAIRGHRWDRLFGGEWVPVIGPEHRDGEIIGFPYLHYHIDWRFASKRLFKRASQRYSFVAPMDDRNVYNRVLHRWPIQNKQETMEDPFHSGGIVLRRRKCQREFPDYPRDLATWLPALEKSCAGLTMQNMTCPHRGMPLASCPREGDVVTCPGHGLRWNVKTGELVQ